MKIYTFYLSVFLVLFFASCSKDGDVVPWANETFEEDNKPSFEEIDDEDDSYTSSNILSSYLLKPWNYEKEYNSGREYPLVVFLHGSGAYPYIPKIVSILGYNNDEYKQNYPSFVLTPRFTGQWGNDFEELAGKIENIKNNYRIDESRIYIVGYSMGAYWGLPFLNYYKEHNGTVAAAFVSEAGLSSAGSAIDIIGTTSIWIHIGDEDGSYSRTMNLFNSLKSEPYFDNAIESTASVNIEGYETSATTILTLNNIEVLKNTVYKETGHGVSSLPFKDPLVLEWMFSQDASKR